MNIDRKPFAVKIGTDRVKVYTAKGPQQHRSQRGYVYLWGEPHAVKCCTRIHHKATAARACGERTAKALLKERAAKDV